MSDETEKIETLEQLEGAIFYEITERLGGGYASYLKTFFDLLSFGIGGYRRLSSNPDCSHDGLSLDFLAETLDRNFNAMKHEVDKHFQEFERNQQKAGQ